MSIGANTSSLTYAAWQRRERPRGLGDRSQGGKLQDFTLGVNWYLNPNVHVMWNYIFADLADGGDGDIFQTRIQVDF